MLDEVLHYLAKADLAVDWQKHVTRPFVVDRNLLDVERAIAGINDSAKVIRDRSRDIPIHDNFAAVERKFTIEAEWCAQTIAMLIDQWPGRKEENVMHVFVQILWFTENDESTNQRTDCGHIAFQIVGALKPNQATR